jgi:hypothetical protein
MTARHTPGIRTPGIDTAAIRTLGIDTASLGKGNI